MTEREALKLAMGALEKYAHDFGSSDLSVKAMYVARKTLAQRTWVGLTDEEIKDCFKITPDQHLPWHIYQRIEAKLKEKNSA